MNQNITCRVCDGTEFTSQAGMYFCNECQTQTLEIQEIVADFEGDDNEKSRRVDRVKIRREKVKPNTNTFSSYELYNVILVRLVDELIALGASNDLKLTVLQLWSGYLGKLGFAFTSKKEECLPKLSAAFKKIDVELIYGRKTTRKKRKNVNEEKRGDLNDMELSNKLLNLTAKKLAQKSYDSQLVENDLTQTADVTKTEPLQFNDMARKELLSRMSKTHLREHVRKGGKQCHQFTTTEATGTYLQNPCYFSRKQLYAILYLGLLHTNSPIHLGDMLRFIREGHLSYQNYKHLLSEEMAAYSALDKYLNVPNKHALSHEMIRKSAWCIFKKLNGRNLPHPNVVEMCRRYVKELALPKTLLKFIEYLIKKHPPATNQTDNIPNHEARAIAYILFAMKHLLGMDDVTEWQTSEVASELNALKIPDNPSEVMSAASVDLENRDDNKTALRFWLNDERGVLNEWNDANVGSVSEKSSVASGRFKTFFNFRDWLKYLEYRKFRVATNHYPSHKRHLKHVFDAKFVETFANECEKRREVVVDNFKNTHATQRQFAFRELFENLAVNLNIDANDASMKLDASLTPFASYFADVQRTSDVKNESEFLKTGFSTDPQKYDDSLIDYLLEPLKYHAILFDNCDQLKTINSSAVSLYEIQPIREPNHKPQAHEHQFIVYKQDTRRKSKRKRYDDTLEVNKSLKNKKKLKTIRMSLEADADVADVSVICDDLLDGEIRKNQSLNLNVQNRSKTLTLFNPTRNYWLNHIDSSVNASQFYDVVERKLPCTFRWLLRECANMCEMRTWDVYRELMVVEVELTRGLSVVEFGERGVVRNDRSTGDKKFW